eukprot:RCo033324
MTGRAAIGRGLAFVLLSALLFLSQLLGGGCASRGAHLAGDALENPWGEVTHHDIEFGQQRAVVRLQRGHGVVCQQAKRITRVSAVTARGVVVQDAVRPAWGPALRRGNIIHSAPLVIPVSGREVQLAFGEGVEASPLRAQQDELLVLSQGGPVAGIDQFHHTVRGKVDAVVQIPEEEDVVIGQELHPAALVGNLFGAARDRTQLRRNLLQPKVLVQLALVVVPLRELHLADDGHVLRIPFLRLLGVRGEVGSYEEEPLPAQQQPHPNRALVAHHPGHPGAHHAVADLPHLPRHALVHVHQNHQTHHLLLALGDAVVGAVPLQLHLDLSSPPVADVGAFRDYRDEPHLHFLQAHHHHFRQPPGDQLRDQVLHSRRGLGAANVVRHHAQPQRACGEAAPKHRTGVAVPLGRLCRLSLHGGPSQLRSGGTARLDPCRRCGSTTRVPLGGAHPGSLPSGAVVV